MRSGTSSESAEKFSTSRLISLLRLVCFEPPTLISWLETLDRLWLKSGDLQTSLTDGKIFRKLF